MTKWFVRVAILGGYVALVLHFGWPGVLAAVAHVAILLLAVPKGPKN